MATIRDIILTELRTRGALQYVSSVNAAGQSVQHLAVNQDYLRASAIRMGSAVGRAFDNFGRALTRWGVRLGAMTAVAASAMTVVGLKFNAAMENAQVAYKNLLGSERAATAMLKRLTKLTTETPFRLEQVTLYGQQLLGAGVAGRDLVGVLQTVADATAGVGRPEALESINRAIVQIASSSALYREDLNQLRDAGVPIYKLLQKRLHMTGKELDKALATGAITNTATEAKALNDVLGALQDQYKGMAKDQSKTFSGMLSNLQDVGQVLAGTVSKPLFDVLERRVFPKLLDFSEMVQRTFADTSLTFDQKVQEIKRLAELYLKPLAHDFVTWWNREHIADRIDNFIDKASPVILEKVAWLARKAVTTFLKAWWHSSDWTKLWIGIVVLSQFGAFQIAGAAAANVFVAAFGARLASGLAAISWAVIGNVIGRGLAAGAATAFVMYFLMKIKPIKDFYESLGKGGKREFWYRDAWKGLKEELTPGKFWKGFKQNWDRMLNPGHRQFGGPVSRGWPYIVGEAGPELFVPNMAGSILPAHVSAFTPRRRDAGQPNLGAGLAVALKNALEITVVSELDGKVVAQSVSRHTADKIARR